MIDLHSAATHNSWNSAVTLGELALPHTVEPIDPAAEQQKQAWHPKNPNGRILAIVDHEEAALALLRFWDVYLRWCMATPHMESIWHSHGCGARRRLRRVSTHHGFEDANAFANANTNGMLVALGRSS